MWLGRGKIGIQGNTRRQNPSFVLDKTTASGITRNAPRKMSRIPSHHPCPQNGKEVCKPVTPTLEQSHPVVYGIWPTRTQRQKAEILLQGTWGGFSNSDLGWTVFTKKMCRSSNPWYLWIWPYSEIRSLQVWLKYKLSSYWSRVGS